MSVYQHITYMLYITTHTHINTHTVRGVISKYSTSAVQCRHQLGIHAVYSDVCVCVCACVLEQRQARGLYRMLLTVTAFAVAGGRRG